jgi:nucleoside-diphosphate-sugar epimerase
MKFIVTGGAGFIGHNVVQLLESEGHDCFIIDSVTDYGFVPEEELRYLFAERNNRIRAGVHHVDIRDHKGVSDFFNTFADADAVIHLASFPRQKVVSANPVWGSDVMSTGLVNLLELTKQYRIPKFVYVSSSMVYGDFDNDVQEHHDCQPQGQYGIMKLMGENLVKDYTRRGCFNHVIVRPSAVYGPYDVEDRVVSKFMLTALRGGTLKVNGAGESLDFTHVSDTAAGIVQATLIEDAVNRTYNITRSQARSLLSAAQLVVDIVGQGNIVIGDKDENFPSRGSLNIDAAREAFGFDPQVNIEQGFEQYYRWFKESSYWQAKI